MRVVIFCHSLVSDWNHGNAHFLRGVATELQSRGHDLRVFEPADGWSRTNLVSDHGDVAVDGFHAAYPSLASETYSLDTLDVAAAVDDADLAIVHEWTDPRLVAAIGRRHAEHGTGVLLFHDSHHRSVTDPAAMASFDLRHYDGVLAFGDPIRDRYLERRWAARAWTWHEAADTRVFRPLRDTKGSMPPGAGLPADLAGDAVWIGNWGDEERTAELEEFFFEPVKRLGLRATVFGVRYPDAARQKLAQYGIDYRGWLPNYQAPAVFARFAFTVHVPRRPYLEALPGIPTIRPFEALACGIPLISARWQDTGGLFSPGDDFLVAQSGDEMVQHMTNVLHSQALRDRLIANGLAAIQARNTCAHRVDQLLGIHAEVRNQVVLS